MSSRQELIELAILSTLKNNDNTARQYLKLRQAALQLGEEVQREVKDQGKVSPETGEKLLQMQLDVAKQELSYSSHVDRLISRIDYLETEKPHFTASLQQQVETVAGQKAALSLELEDLRTKHKPVVEKMKSMAGKFNGGVVVPAKRAHATRCLAKKGSQPDDSLLLIDFDSTVFTKLELAAMFNDVEAKLASLKTVDEIDEETQPTEKSEPKPSINIAQYLDELLRSSSAYLNMGDQKYHYDIARSSAPNVGSASGVLDDYMEGINSLTGEIQELVERGTEAKERWVHNARKMDLIKATLADAMDVD